MRKMLTKAGLIAYHTTAAEITLIGGFGICDDAENTHATDTLCRFSTTGNARSASTTGKTEQDTTRRTHRSRDTLLLITNHESP